MSFCSICLCATSVQLNIRCVKWIQPGYSNSPLFHHNQDSPLEPQIMYIDHTRTLPKTNSSPMKIGYPKRKLGFQQSIFRGYVCFREGKISEVGLANTQVSIEAVEIQLCQSSIYPLLKHTLHYHSEIGLTRMNPRLDLLQQKICHIQIPLHHCSVGTSDI